MKIRFLLHCESWIRYIN